MSNARKSAFRNKITKRFGCDHYGEREDLSYANYPNDAPGKADSLVIVAEWEALKTSNFSMINLSLNKPVIINGRNLFESADPKALGYEYYGIKR